MCLVKPAFRRRGEVSLYFAITEMDEFLGNEEVLGAQTAGENARGSVSRCERSLWVKKKITLFQTSR